jgi:hypothetical protein
LLEAAKIIWNKYCWQKNVENKGNVRLSDGVFGERYSFHCLFKTLARLGNEEEDPEGK